MENVCVYPARWGWLNLRHDDLWRIMSYMTNHKEWFDRITNYASGRAAGAAAEIPIATLNRQLGKGELSAEFVIALARAYGVSPTASLVQTGYLNPDEASDLTVAEMAELLTDQDIIRIMAFRINNNPEAWEGTFDEVIDSAEAPSGNVVQLNRPPATPDDEEIAAAIKRANERPRAAHPATDIEYIEPEFP